MIEVTVVDGQTAEAIIDGGLYDFADGHGVTDGYHIDARHHDFTDDGVAEFKNTVDQFFLFFF